MNGARRERIRSRTSERINNKNKVVDPGRKTQLTQGVHDVTAAAVTETRPDRPDGQVPQRRRSAANVVVQPLDDCRPYSHRPPSRLRRSVAVTDEKREEVLSQVGVVLGQRTKFPLNAARLRVTGRLRRQRRRRNRILTHTHMYLDVMYLFPLKKI